MPKLLNDTQVNEILKKYNDQNGGSDNREMNNIIGLLKKYKNNQSGGGNKYNFFDSISDLKTAFREHFFN